MKIELKAAIEKIQDGADICGVLTEYALDYHYQEGQKLQEQQKELLEALQNIVEGHELGSIKYHLDKAKEAIQKATP